MVGGDVVGADLAGGRDVRCGSSGGGYDSLGKRGKLRLLVLCGMTWTLPGEACG